MSIFKKMFILFFALSITVLSGKSAQAELRPVLGPEMKEKMFNMDRTFWHWVDIDRFHFKTNGILTHQINQDWGNIPLGTILNATWRIKDDKSLCWTYDERSAQMYGARGENCFDLYTDTPKDEFMVGNHPNIRLKPAGAGVEARSRFRFFSWHRGDYSFDPAYVEDVYKAMDTMKHYRRQYNGRIPGGTINRDAMNPNMQKFYDLAIGRVFRVSHDYMYFDPHGDYYWITEDKFSDNLEQMLDDAEIGSWTIRDNIMCWRVDKASCEYIFPQGEGLLNQEFDTFLGTFYTGMTRKHRDEDEHVLHLDFDETPAPELFKRFAQMSKDARSN